MVTEIDYMEYTTDALAKAAYVTNATTTTLAGSDSTSGTNSGANTAVSFAKFTCSANGTATHLRVYSQATGNAKMALYSDNAGEPNARLVSVSGACSANQWNYIAITPTALTSGTVYWVACIGDTNGIRYQVTSGGTRRFKTGLTYATYSFPDPAGSGYSSDSYTMQAGAVYYNLEAYSEGTIKTQGTYSLKAIAKSTDSLNKTLTKTL